MFLNLKIGNENRQYLIPRFAISFIRKYMGLGTVGAEIGVYQGSHAVEILTELKPSKLFLIDPWDYKGDCDTLPCTNVDFEVAKANVKDYSQAEMMIKKSSEAVGDFIDGILDWVYIDAEHSYESVKNDITIWTPKVKKGGVIAGHDVRVAGVRKAVDEFKGLCPYEGEDWILIKRV